MYKLITEFYESITLNSYHFMCPFLKIFISKLSIHIITLKVKFLINMLKYIIHAVVILNATFK